MRAGSSSEKDAGTPLGRSAGSECDIIEAVYPKISLEIGQLLISVFFSFTMSIRSGCLYSEKIVTNSLEPNKIASKRFRSVLFSSPTFSLAWKNGISTPYFAHSSWN